MTRDEIDNGQMDKWIKGHDLERDIERDFRRNRAHS